MKFRSAFLVIALVVTLVSPGFAEPPAEKKSDQPTASSSQTADEVSKTEASLKMLHSILKLQTGLNQRIDEKSALLKKSDSPTEKELLTSELGEMDQQINDYGNDFERIATGIDISLFNEKKEEAFDWKNEVVGLVEPGIKEIKRMTVRARYKAKLKDELTHYENLVPVAKQAVDNITRFISETKDTQLKTSLKNLLPEWQSIEKQIQNKLEIVKMRLLEMEKEEKSFIETSKNSIKNFFRTRGLFLTIAICACIGVLFVFRLIAQTLVRFIPGYKEEYRPFHIRMINLISRILSFLLILFVLIFVFYIFEDWVLLSLTIIFIMGIGWAAKHTLPQYWHQSRLILNIGAVREGERMMYQGVPWLVREINLFSEIENPDLGVKLRLPIEELLDRTSRVFNKKESWFPCRKGDWVILSDGTRGVIISQSHEIVEMAQRGGAHKTYLTQDFLSLSPLNISVNFRLKIPFGISYDLQKESTNTVLDTLKAFIEEQIEKEGYKDDLLNLRVEFMQAAASSLDMVVIADFRGEMAPLYQRIVRAINRWCVDACTANNWEIPFTQIQIHQ